MFASVDPTSGCGSTPNLRVTSIADWTIGDESAIVPDGLSPIISTLHSTPDSLVASVIERLS